MSKQTKTSPFITGDFISEGAVRGALGRRRRSRRVRVTAQPDDSRRVTQARSASGRGTPLRRWSVADLIAKAVPPPLGE